MPFESQITFLIVFTVVTIVYHVYFSKVIKDNYYIIHPDEEDSTPSVKTDANWIHNDTSEDKFNSTHENDTDIPTYPAHIVFKDEPTLAEMEFEDLRYPKKGTNKQSKKGHLGYIYKRKQVSEEIEFEDMRHPDRREKRPHKREKKKVPIIPKLTNEVCYIIDVFLITDVAEPFCDPDDELILMEKQNAQGSSAIGATFVCVLLVYSVSKAIYDLLRYRNVESIPPPDSELLRRCSLAEFANEKEACLQLNHFSRRDSVLMDTANGMIKRGMCRIDSSNSFLGRKRRESLMEGKALVTSGVDSPNASPVQREVRMLGGRPVPLLRRSSFPAAPLTPDGRRQSVDSEDDSSTDGIRRRVRLIRRR